MPADNAHLLRKITWNHIVIALMCAFMLLAPLPAEKLVSSPVVTVADAVFVIAVAAVFPQLLRSPFRPNLIWLFGSGLLIGIGLLCIAAVPDPAAVQGAMRLAYAIGFIPAVFALWGPDLKTLGVLGLFYVFGAVISVLGGVLNGTDPDGRNHGLSLHPNGMAAACILAIALAPLVAATLPRFRMVAGGCVVILLYGLWISGSRGALIALAVLVLAYTIRKQSVPLLLTSVGALTGAFYVAITTPQTSSNALARLLGGRGSSDADGQRQLAVTKALHEITQNPFLGAGFSHIREAQNSLLEVAAAIGVPAMLAFFTVLIGLATPVFSKDKIVQTLGYPAIGFIGLALTSDTVSDTFAWAPLAIAAVAASAAHANDVFGVRRGAGREVDSGGSSAATTLPAQMPS